jgi:RHS repeat protein
VTLATAPEGNSTAYTYDANSNVLTVTKPVPILALIAANGPVVSEHDDCTASTRSGFVDRPTQWAACPPVPMARKNSCRLLY